MRGCDEIQEESLVFRGVLLRSWCNGLPVTDQVVLLVCRRSSHLGFSPFVSDKFAVGSGRLSSRQLPVQRAIGSRNKAGTRNAPLTS